MSICRSWQLGALYAANVASASVCPLHCRGRQVHLLKRAQIFVADVWGAFQVSAPLQHAAGPTQPVTVAEMLCCSHRLIACHATAGPVIWAL